MLEQDWKPQTPSHRPMIGLQGGLKKTLNVAAKMAQADEPILICGATGTGKTLLAKHIHAQSHRQNAPFMEIPCSSLNENLIESELFGHTRGAFTGAHQNQCGKLTLSNHGTVFLDEIGELSPHAQKRLLHFLQEGFFYRVGSHKPEIVDVRIVAATNRDLVQMVKNHTFRKDLFFRLAVLRIHMPNLCERGEDVLELAKFLLADRSKKSGKEFILSERARQQILTHSWPGNVRELENVIKRSMISLEPGHRIIEQLEFDELDMDVESPSVSTPFTNTAQPDPNDFNIIREALINNQGCLNKAAAQLGLSRFAFYRRMKKFGLTKNSAMTWYAWEMGS